jgi:tetratricopeptide (TPR) repeat protein
MMRTIPVAALLLLFVAPAFCQNAEQTPRQMEAKNEIYEGARAYRAGKFDEAQQRFERALELDPESRSAPFFIARAIHSQFKPNLDTPENIAIARAAIAAYHRVLNSDPLVDEAYNAIVYLYGQIKDEAAMRQWLMARVADTQVPAFKRAQAYTLLASFDWNCAYTITERKEHRSIVTTRRKVTTKYLKPKDETEFQQAKGCAERGLELVEQAVGLDADSLHAWSYKTHLLLELVKLAEMDENEPLKSDYQRQATEAQRRTTELSELEKRGRKRRPINLRRRHGSR